MTLYLILNYIIYIFDYQRYFEGSRLVVEFKGIYHFYYLINDLNIYFLLSLLLGENSKRGRRGEK